MRQTNFSLMFAGFVAAMLNLVFATGASAQSLKNICPDINQEPCATAKKAIISSQVIVMGDEPKGDEWTYTAEAMLKGTYTGSSMEDKIKAGLKFSDAVNFWKGYLASPLTGDGNRQAVTKLAFFEVYGAYPTIDQNKALFEQMKQKKAWYATIVSSEQGNLNKDDVKRKQVINRVYTVVMGRSAKADEYDKWLKNTYDFRQMYVATRSFLYTKEGNADLRDTVRRALTFLTKKNPSQAEIQDAINKYAANKVVHAQMINNFPGYSF